MAQCEGVNLTLSDSDSDGDFIQAKKAIYLFLYQVSVHQISITSSSYYNGNYFTELVHVCSNIL